MKNNYNYLKKNNKVYKYNKSWGIMEARVKEIQKKITEKNENKGATEEEFLSILKLIVPGTNLRAALDGALRVGKGALIVIDNGNTLGLFEGGFRINTNFTPQKLIELDKNGWSNCLQQRCKKNKLCKCPY